MKTHVYEGWTVGDFIEELDWQLDMIQSGQSWKRPIATAEELKKWLQDNQPYYKKHIPKVFNYFRKKYRL